MKYIVNLFTLVFLFSCTSESMEEEIIQEIDPIDTIPMVMDTLQMMDTIPVMDTTMIDIDTMDQNTLQESDTLDLGPFLVIVPIPWEYQELKGIDTYVGKITDGEDEIIFDYGFLNFGSLDDVQPNNNTISLDEFDLNGYPAKLVISQFSDDVTWTLYTVKDDNNKNVLFCRNPKDEDAVMSIYLSHLFL